MKNESIWIKNNFNEALSSINKDMNVDILIIGGGMTGLSALYHLRNSKLKTILVERGQCGMGVTSRSTAKITYLQQDIFNKIKVLSNEENAKLYLKSQIDAVSLLVGIIKDNNIKCNLEKSPSYLFTNDEKNINKFDELVRFLIENNVQINCVSELPFPEPFIKAACTKDTYTFNPIQYINHLKKLFQNSIYEYSNVTDIKKEKDHYKCRVGKFTIKSKQVIIASHYPFFLFPFLMPFKGYIETSYIGTKKTNIKESFNAINIDKPCISLRTYNSGNEKQLIYLYQSMPSANIKDVKYNFQELINKGFNNVWSNKDIITYDYLPFIGKIKDGIYIATGYNTWGMTNGTLAGKILADIIQEKSNPYINLFNPKRTINIGKVINYPNSIEKSAKAFIKSNRFNVNNASVSYEVRDGKNVAIYKDNKGKEHIVLNRCPHMKCGIIFNEVEQTWDCYCHGSRFDIDGKTIEGPSNFDIKFKSE